MGFFLFFQVEDGLLIFLDNIFLRLISLVSGLSKVDNRLTLLKIYIVLKTFFDYRITSFKIESILSIK